MKNYKIYFERKGIDPVEFTISGEGDKCRVKTIRIGKENHSFDFLGSEEILLKAVSIKLEKYGVEKIEKIS